MNKLNYGSYDPSITDIAFSSANGYTDPSSELDLRRQLSMPLKEVKEFVNKTVSTDADDKPIQLVVSEENKLQYRTEPEAEPIDITTTSIPTGGSAGNLLRKTSSEDYAMDWGNSLPILTSAPSGDNANGVILVYLESEPETKYSGYIYLIKE